LPKEDEDDGPGTRDTTRLDLVDDHTSFEVVEEEEEDAYPKVSAKLCRKQVQNKSRSHSHSHFHHSIRFDSMQHLIVLYNNERPQKPKKFSTVFEMFKRRPCKLYIFESLPDVKLLSEVSERASLVELTKPNQTKPNLT